MDGQSGSRATLQGEEEPGKGLRDHGGFFLQTRQLPLDKRLRDGSALIPRQEARQPEEALNGILYLLASEH